MDGEDHYICGCKLVLLLVSWVSFLNHHSCPALFCVAFSCGSEKPQPRCKILLYSSMVEQTTESEPNPISVYSDVSPIPSLKLIPREVQIGLLSQSYPVILIRSWQTPVGRSWKASLYYCWWPLINATCSMHFKYAMQMEKLFIMLPPDPCSGWMYEVSCISFLCANWLMLVSGDLECAHSYTGKRRDSELVKQVFLKVSVPKPDYKR